MDRKKLRRLLQEWMLPGAIVLGVGLFLLYRAIPPLHAYSATLSRIAGAGEVRISIAYAQSASSFGSGTRKPTGAVIVAQGANSVTVRLELLRAAETLLGLSASQVEVFPMEESGRER